MRFLPVLLVPLLLFVLSACSPVQLLNNLSPVAGLRVEQGIAYGEAPRQTLDVYAPPNAQDAPVVVFIHGGSWRGGSREEYKFVGASLARAGYVTAVINYRLAPEHRYPDYIRDAANAIKWLRGNAQRFGGDPDSLFVAGHSAGAFNAVETVVNERWLDEVNVPIESIQGVIGIAGPYDYDFREGDTRTAFPEGATPQQVMPVYHVRDNPPPALLLTAENDTVVGPHNAKSLTAALQREGGTVIRKEIPNVNHYTIIGALSSNLTFLGPVRESVVEFIERFKTPAEPR